MSSNGENTRVISGRYTLDVQVGRGGMGVVWRGEDRMLGRTVALKRVGMMPGGSEPDLVRAEREARLAARLNHPHIVAIFDLVADGDEHWLVMEYVPGRTLGQQVAERGPLEPEEARTTLLQAADALAAAHGADILHRDVKPSNILIREDGSAKLTDFGIARATADATLTQTGLVTGSPAYLAPEVASGGRASAASDVWALGATLYHALEARPPYEMGGNVMAGMYQIVHGPVPRSDRAGLLAVVLENTLVKDPEARWSMAEVRDALADPGRLAASPVGTSGPDAEDGTGTATVATPSVAALAARATARDDADYDDEDDGDPVWTTVETPEEPGPVAVAPPPGPTGPTEATGPTETSGDDAVPPVIAAPPRERKSGRRRPLLLALAAVAVVLALIGLTLSLGNDEPSGDAPVAEPTAEADPSESDEPSASASPSESASTPDGAAAPAARQRAFVREYLSLVTSNPRSSWQMLTPEFQSASGGFADYSGFWGTIASATPLSITPDPESGQVSYRVQYERQNGSTATSDVTLQLVESDGGYLIADEL